MNLKSRLGRLALRRLEWGSSLAPYTSFRLGGAADALVFPESEDEVARVLALCAERDVPCLIVGNGSNLLVRDGGFRGVALVMTGLSGDARLEGREVIAPASMQLVALCRWMAKRDVGGLEWASGIPGTVGGAAVMNAGAHGQDMASFVRRVRAVLPGSGTAWLGPQDLSYRYRHSSLQESGAAVVAAAFGVLDRDGKEGMSLIRSYLAQRKATQPVGNNAGSMFKNPPGDYAGRLIEAVGGKGRRSGGVEISTMHANFFLNRGGGRAADVLDLAGWVQEAVAERFGVSLELEVRVVGQA